jgi:uncharacterized protein (TIGR02996 family)
LSQELSQRLLQVILASPDDDAARMVYADFLVEQGEPARAELIQLQLESARLPAWDPERVRLELRERWLLHAHEARWRAQLPVLEGVSWGRFSRGFVERAAFADMRALKAHVEACCAVTPLRSVAVRWPPQREWTGLPPFPGLRELTLHGSLFHASDMQGLAESPWLSSVRALNLLESGVDQDVLQHLLASPNLGQLTALRLPHHLLRSVAALVRARTLPALTELDLSVPTTDDLGSGGRDADTLGAADMRQLATWRGLARLRTLDLSGNLIGAGGLKALLSSPHATGLQELHLREISNRPTLSFEAFLQARPELSLDVLSLQNHFDVEGAAKLSEAACLAELKVLRLSYMTEQEDGAFYDLVQAPWFDSLRELDVTYADALPLLQALPSRAPAKLHTLKLESALSWSPSLPALKKLADSPASGTLLHLDLSYNSMAEPVLKVLSEARGLQNLQSLVLGDYRNVSQEAYEQFERSPLGRRLVSFEIGTNEPKHRRLPRPERTPLALGTYRGPLMDL